MATSHRPCPVRSTMAGALAALVVAGCSTSSAPEPGEGAPALSDTHVHGVARPSPDGPVYLATHDGLLTYAPDGQTTRVGPVIDLMGFAALGEDHFIASGHPGPGVDLPQPVGLIESVDGGRSWAQVSRGGESDFHLLSAADSGTVGFDGALWTTEDHRRWQQGSTPGQLVDMAVRPGTEEVVATTADGVVRSPDLGATWETWSGAPDLVLLDWADARIVVGLTAQGEVTLSRDGGQTWRVHSTLTSPVQAMSATAATDGQIEVLIATDTDVEVLTVPAAGR